jgi:hypothetical protein
MKALLALATLPACFIEAPSGAELTWPPPLGLTVEAVAAGDLDSNGSTDLVVLGSGAKQQAGLYLLTGGRDLLLQTGATPAKSFSRFVPYDTATPSAALYASPTLYVATGSVTAELIAFSNVLDETASVATTVTQTTSRLWIERVAFPGGNVHTAVSNGATIDHSRDLTDVRAVPAPGSPTWNSAQAVTSYASGADQIAVVADSQTIQRSPLPGPTTMQFSWSIVRQGASWVGQTAIDLDNDMRDEIVGFDPATKQLCVVAPSAATLPVTPACIATNAMSPATDVTLFVGTNFTMNAAPDLVIMQTGSVDTRFTVLEDYTFTGGALASAMIRPLQTAGGPNARAVAITAAPGMPHALVMFGRDGVATCVIGPC